MNRFTASACILFLLAFSSFLRADQIHLKDKRVINGKVLEQTEKSVKYRTDKGTESIDSSLVDRIVYEDGDGKKDIPRPQPVLPDTIVLLDGTIIKGTILRMTDKYIAYCPENSKVQLILSLDFVSRVVSKDGVTREINALKKPARD